MAGVRRVTEGACQEKKSLTHDSLLGCFVFKSKDSLLANGAYASESEHVDTDTVFTYSSATCTLPLSALGLSAAGCESCRMGLLA